MAEALYRKYRPQVFEDVVGQEPIERTLKNAIVQDKVSHAYLFCGPRGTGKTTTARLLAKALMCKEGPTPEPDGTCEDCQLIADGVHPDVYELDAASRTGVENVREEIISRVQFAPTRGRNKVYIIDEVHMLSTAAFNALLKTLEEPPAHVVFILCTTDPQKVPETIHSRCQRFDFHRIAPESMVARLGAICVAEHVEFEGEALDLIAHRAEGGLRNALTSLEQIIAFENGKVTLAGAERLLGSIDSNDLAEIMAYVGTRDIANCFRWTSAYVETGADLAQFVRDMAEHVRNLYVLSLAGDEVELDVSETTRRELTRELQWFGPERASRLLSVLGDLSAELKTSSNPRLEFEIALTRMVRPDSDLTLEALAERVEALEGGYSAVAHVLPGRPLQAEGAGRPLQAEGVGRPLKVEGAGLPGSAQGEGELPAGGHADERAPAAQPGAVPAAQPGAGQPEAEAVQPAAEATQPASAQPEAVQPASARSASQGEGAVVQGRAVDSQAAAAQGHAVDSQAAAAHEAAQGGSGAAVGQAAPNGAEAAGEAAVSSKLASLSNPAALQRIWQATLNAIKKEKQAYGVLFMNTKAAFDESANAVRVLFPASSTFAFNAVQKPDVQDMLAQVLAKAVGEPVPFRLEQMDGAQRESAQQPAAAPQPSSGQQPMTDQQPAPAQQRESGRQPTQPSSQASHEAPPYEEVPYEDVFYEAVPYEELDGSVGSTAQPRAAASEDAPFQRQSQASGRQEGGLTPARPDGDPSPVRQDGGPSSAGPDDLPAPAGPDDYPSPAVPETSPLPPDASTEPSPGDRRDENGTLSEDVAGLQAMLQAGFGNGVVISEVEE